MVLEKDGILCSSEREGLAGAETARTRGGGSPSPRRTRSAAPAAAAEGRPARSAWSRFLRRRRYLVYSRLQFHLMVDQLIGLLVFCSVLAGVLLYPLVTEFQEPGREGAARNEKANALLFLHDRVWLIFGLGILAVLLLSLRSSHRIAGALCRFRGVFGRVAAGSIPASIRIRRDDYIHREEDALNRALDRLHAGIGEIEEAREGLDRLAGDLEGDRRRRLDEDLARLERGLAQLRRERHGQG